MIFDQTMHPSLPIVMRVVRLAGHLATLFTRASPALIWLRRTSLNLKPSVIKYDNMHGVLLMEQLGHLGRTRVLLSDRSEEVLCHKFVIVERRYSQ